MQKLNLVVRRNDDLKLMGIIHGIYVEDSKPTEIRAIDVLWEHQVSDKRHKKPIWKPFERMVHTADSDIPLSEIKFAPMDKSKSIITNAKCLGKK